VRLGQGLVSQNPWRALTSASLFFSASGALVLDPRYQTSLGRPPAFHPLLFPPASPRGQRFLTGSSPPARGSFSRRSSSVPTRRLGLRPITCLPVIRCCANPPSPASLAGQFPLCSRRLENLENLSPTEGIRNNHRPHNRGVSIVIARYAKPHSSSETPMRFSRVTESFRVLPRKKIILYLTN